MWQVLPMIQLLGIELFVSSLEAQNTHPNLEPLTYPILIIEGEDGWGTNIIYIYLCNNNGDHLLPINSNININQILWLCPRTIRKAVCLLLPLCQQRLPLCVEVGLYSIQLP